jgi:hypothetical protein
MVAARDQYLHACSQPLLLAWLANHGRPDGREFGPGDGPRSNVGGQAVTVPHGRIGPEEFE